MGGDMDESEVPADRRAGGHPDPARRVISFIRAYHRAVATGPPDSSGLPGPPLAACADHQLPVAPIEGEFRAVLDRATESAGRSGRFWAGAVPAPRRGDRPARSAASWAPL